MESDHLELELILSLIGNEETKLRRENELLLCSYLTERDLTSSSHDELALGGAAGLVHGVLVRLEAQRYRRGEAEPRLQLLPHVHYTRGHLGVPQPDADLVPAVPHAHDGAVYDVPVLPEGFACRRN